MLRPPRAWGQQRPLHRTVTPVWLLGYQQPSLSVHLSGLTPLLPSFLPHTVLAPRSRETQPAVSYCSRFARFAASCACTSARSLHRCGHLSTSFRRSRGKLRAASPHGRGLHAPSPPCQPAARTAKGRRTASPTSSSLRANASFAAAEPLSFRKHRQDQLIETIALALPAFFEKRSRFSPKERNFKQDCSASCSPYQRA